MSKTVFETEHLMRGALLGHSLFVDCEILHELKSLRPPIITITQAPEPVQADG